MAVGASDGGISVFDEAQGVEAGAAVLTEILVKGHNQKIKV
jgi:hypothetical protein